MRQVIIVDDEMPSIKRMDKLLKQDGRVKIIGKFASPNQALDFCRQQQVDMIFTDIEMPELNGISFGKEIKKILPKTFIIYMTAYSQYALDAYDALAVGYLLKPIIPEKLAKLLDMLIPESIEIDDLKDKLVAKTMGGILFEKNKKPIRFRTKKSEELFCFLLHKQGQWIVADKIIDILWQEIDLASGKKQLHTTVYYCRKALQNIDMEQLIEYKLGSYRVLMNDIEWDYNKLYRALNNIKDQHISKKELMHIIELDCGVYFGSRAFWWAQDTQNHLDIKLQQLYELQLDNPNISESDTLKIVKCINNKNAMMDNDN